MTPAVRLHLVPNEGVEVEGLRFIAGFVASRLRATHPQLGTSTRLSAPTARTWVTTWIEEVNKGGLTSPSDHFFDLVKQLECCFEKFNGHSKLHTCPGIVKRLTKFMLDNANCQETPEVAVRMFARFRIFVRMRNIGCLAVRDRAYRRQQKKNKKFT